MSRAAAVYLVSIAAHLGLALGVSSIRAEKRVSTAAIALNEVTRKKSEPPKKEAPPEEKPKPVRPSSAAAVPARPKAPAKAEPAPEPAPAAAEHAPASPSTANFARLGGVMKNAGPASSSSPVAGERAEPQPEKKVTRRLSSSPAPAAAGDSCTEEATKPKRLRAVAPLYPPAAREAQIEGSVRFEAQIDEEGRVESVVILEGLGHGLDEATIEAIKQWTFEPAQRCGKPAKATIRSKIGFSLT